MVKKTFVKLTANFERNLENIEVFLKETNTKSAYQALLDEMLNTVIPNLEQFPCMGRLFMKRLAGSIEVINAMTVLQAKLGNGELREYLLSDYLVLYARYEEVVYLLSIKHHRQLSFDFVSHWR